MKITSFALNGFLLLFLIFSCGNKNYNIPHDRNKAIRTLDNRLNQLLLAGLDECGPNPTEENRIIDVISTRYTLIDKHENELLSNIEADDRQRVREVLINNLKRLPNGTLERAMVDDETEYTISYTFLEKKGGDTTSTSLTCSLNWHTEGEKFMLLR